MKKEKEIKNQKLIYPCANCGQHKGEHDVGMEDGLICDGCFELFYTYCEKCDEVMDYENGEYTSDGWYCERCKNER